MANRNKYLRIRNSLWKLDPFCTYCGRKTKLPVSGETSNDSRMATIDHKVSRHQLGLYEDQAKNMVLACHECNQVKSINENFIFKNRFEGREDIEYTLSFMSLRCFD